MNRSDPFACYTYDVSALDDWHRFHYGYEYPYEGKVEDCICPSECDCQNPEPVEGTAGVSNLCPEHNDSPDWDEDCPVVGPHKNGAYTVRIRI